jgi:tRNA (adenine37-N6)-methyltransferase
VVPLLGIEGLKIFVGDVDLLDRTPILDVKPYLRSVDSVPDAGLGWVQDVEDAYAQPPTYVVRIADLASRQLSWLRERHGVELLERSSEILSRDPLPHRTRRIRQLNNGGYEIGCGTWRIFYQLENHEVVIERVYSGYAPTLVFGEVSSFVQEQEVHIAFLMEWGAPGTAIDGPSAG